MNRPDENLQDFDLYADARPFGRDPHGSGLIRGVIIGLILWAVILAAVIAGSHLVTSAMERATHDTAGMICPTPAC